MTTVRSKALSLLIASLLVPVLGAAGCCKRASNPKNPDGGGSCDPLCAVTGIPAASGLDFGNVPIGQPVTLKLTLHNQGTALLNVTGVSITGTNVADYKFGGKLGPEVQQQAASIAQVTFTPATAGTLTASVTIQTDGTPGTLNVPLTGVGIDVEICAHPNTIDFGNVQVLGTPSTIFNGDAGSIAICNCGLSPVSLTFPGIEGPQASDFSDTGESNETLQPNQCENITISYSPGVLGPSTADLPYGVCTGCPTQSINLTGVGVDGQLTFSPSPVNFGSPPPPPPAPTAQVTATNTGTENLVLTNLGTYNNPSPFVVSGAPAMPLTMAPLQSFTFTITYNTSGSATGDQDELLGVFTVADPAVAPRTVQDLLSGNESLGPCSLGVTPSSVNFGLVPAQQVGTRQVTLTNSGGTACDVSVIALSASTDPYFGLGVGQATSLTVQPGSSQQITVTFSPTSTNAPLARTGQLTFQTGDPVNPSATVPLSATIEGQSVYSGGWPKWHLDNFNSGQSTADTSGDTGVVTWKYNIGVPGSGMTYINSPVISTVTGVSPPPAGGYVIYQMGMAGKVHAIAGGAVNQGGGTLLWQQPLNAPGGDPHPSTGAVLADGSMFFVTNDDGLGNNASLYYLSSAGAVTFSEPFGEDGFDSCPTLGQDGTLFLADDDGSVSDGSGETSANAFGASAGAVSQIGGLSLPLTNESERFGVVVAADDTSYWGNNGQFFAITPPKAGFGLVAAWPKAGVTLATSGSAVSDLALDNFTNNNLYAYSGWLNGNSVQGNIAALNPATGAQKWIFNMPAAAVSAAIVNSTCPGGDACSAAGNAAPAIALDGTVYVGNGDGLYAINGATGAKLWVSSCGDVTSSPAIGADGTIFFGCGDGILYAVNPNGTLKFKVTTGGPISSSPAIAPDGTVVFISDDGNLYAIN